ncbi:MAG: hypothetical protein KDN22_16420 [Verrucomicrobiae bacterium]|nr:hypothetical protein [Verrucomicrobiae bacterium]
MDSEERKRIQWVMARAVAAGVGFVVAFFYGAPQRLTDATVESIRHPVSRESPVDRSSSLVAPGMLAFAPQLAGLEDADVSEMPLLISGAEELPWEQRNLAIQFILTRWLELDPQGALAYCGSEEARSKHQHIQNFLFREWAGMDPEAALAGWLTLPVDTLRKWAAEGLLLGLSRHGPEVYLQFLVRLPEDAVPSAVGLDRMFEMLTAENRESALLRALSLPEKFQPDAFAGIARDWIESDSEAALAWADQLTAGNPRDSAFSAILNSGWAHHHPEEAGPLFQNLTNTYRTSPRPIILKLLESDPLKAADWASRYLSYRQISEHVRRDIVPAMMKTDPAMIGELVSTLAQGENGIDLASAAFWDLKSGHSEAFAALANYPDDEIRLGAFRGVISSWDFDAAAAAIESLPAAAREALLPELAEAAMPGLDPAEKSSRLLDYIANNAASGSSSRAALIANVASDFIKSDPAAVAELLQKYPEAIASKQRDIVLELVGGWADTNQQPLEAAAWAATLSEPEQRESAFAAIARIYAESDSAAASQWLTTLPLEGTVRDKAIAAFSETIRERDPEAGIAWAGTITDPALRSTTMGMLVDQLGWDDPASARHFIESAAIEERDRQVLLERIEHP